MTPSEHSIALMDYLISVGKNEEAFAESFPIIHHFRESGGNASLKGFYEHCQNHEIAEMTNMNVYRRLQSIERQTREFLLENPDHPGISFIKFQRYAKNAVADIPF